MDKVTMERTDTTVQPVVEASQQATTTAPEVQAQTTAAAQPPPAEPEKPLTRAEARELALEAAREAAREAAGLAREAGRRELQSQQDRNRIERDRLQRDANVGNRIRESVKGTEYEPIVEGAAKDARLSAYEQEETARQQSEAIQAARQEFYAKMQTRVGKMGIGLDDKRMDWAYDAPNPDVALDRIMDSAAKIQQETVKSKMTEQEKVLETRMKEFEAKIRKDLGLDSVDTSTPSSGARKGRTPSIEEYREADAFTAKAKVESGEWVLPRGLRL